VQVQLTLDVFLNQPKQHRRRNRRQNGLQWKPWCNLSAGAYGQAGSPLVKWLGIPLKKKDINAKQMQVVIPVLGGQPFAQTKL